MTHASFSGRQVCDIPREFVSFVPIHRKNAIAACITKSGAVHCIHYYLHRAMQQLDIQVNNNTELDTSNGDHNPSLTINHDFVNFANVR